MSLFNLKFTWRTITPVLLIVLGGMFAEAKTEQSIVFDPLSDFTYGDAAHVLTASADSQLSVSFVSLTPDVVSIREGNKMVFVGAGTAVVEARQSGNSKWYAAQNVRQSFVVHKKSLEVSVADATRMYAHNDPVFEFIFSGFVEGDSEIDLDILPNAEPESTFSSDIGSYAVLLTGGSDDNYEYVCSPGVMNIIPQQLRVIADAKSRDQGEANPELTYTIKGIETSPINVEPVDAISIGMSTSATVGSGPGIYPIQCWIESASSNSQISCYGNQMTVGDVGESEQVITVRGLTDDCTYGIGRIALIADSNSGLPVQFTSINEDVAVVEGNSLKIIGVGSVIVVATQVGNDVWKAAEPVVKSFEVTKKALVVSADNKSRVYGEANPEFNIQYSGFVEGEDEASLISGSTVSCSATLTSDATAEGYEITLSGGESEHYEFVYQHGKLFVEKAPLVARVSGGVISRPYGERNPALSIEYSGFLNGDRASDIDREPSIFCDATISSEVREDYYQILLSGGNDNNYDFKYESGYLKIFPRKLEIRAKEVAKVEQEPNPEFKAVFIGLAPVDSEAEFLLDYQCDATEASKPGNYAITPRLLRNNENYDIRLVPSFLRVEPIREQTVALTTDGGHNPSVAIDASGYVHVVYENQGGVWYLKTTRSGDMSGESTVQPKEIIEGAIIPEIVIDSSDNLHVVALKDDHQSFIYLKMDDGANETARKEIFYEQSTQFNYRLYVPAIAINPVSKYPTIAVVSQMDMSPMFSSIPEEWWTPGLSLGAESVVCYELNNNAEIELNQTVFFRQSTISYPMNIKGLDLDLDEDGKVHIAWSDQGSGSRQIAYKRFQLGDEVDSSASTLLFETAGTYCETPSVCIGENGTPGIVWVSDLGLHGAIPGVMSYKTLDVSLGQFDVGGRSQIAFDVNPSGGWNLSWVPSGGHRLVSGKLTNELEYHDILIATSDGLSSPDLVFGGQEPTIVFEQSHSPEEGQLSIYKPAFRGDCYAVTAGSEAWDPSKLQPANVNIPIQLESDYEKMASKDGFRSVSGVIADEVTPLVFKLSGLTDGQTYTFDIQEDDGSAVTSLTNALKVLDTGTWTAGESYEYSANNGADAIVVLNGVSSDDLQWPEAGISQEVNLKLVIRHSSDSSILGTVPFRVGRPPIVLVHDFNSDKSSWSEAFIEKLEQNTIAGGVIAIDYGANLLGSVNAMEYKQNTLLDLKTLSVMLSDRLESEFEGLFPDWAMTRYDAVGHGQGGLLLRSLCRENGDTLTSKFLFRNASNFGKGRFRRVITIGAPHNGSRLAQYLIAMRDEFYRLSEQNSDPMSNQQLFFGFNALVSHLLQGKYSPFMDQLGSIYDLNDSVQTDPTALFHLISSSVDHDLARLKSSYDLMGLNDARLNVLIPAETSGVEVGEIPIRSDGIVGYDSQIASRDISSAYVTLMSRETYLETGVSIPAAHALAQWYGANYTQTDAPWLAQKIVTLLTESDASVSFSPFVNPSIDLGEKAAVEQLAHEAASEKKQHLTSPELVVSTQREQVGRHIVFELNTTIPSEETDFRVEVYSPNRNADSLVDYDDQTKTVSVEVGTIAQVVVLARNGMQYSSPTVIYDTIRQAADKLVIRCPIELSPSEDYDLGIQLGLFDGSTSDYYFDDVNELQWSSSNTEIATLSSVGTLTTGDRFGQSIISANYGELTGTVVVEILNTPPEVLLLTSESTHLALCGEVVSLDAIATDPDSDIERIEIYLNNTLLDSAIGNTLHLDWAAEKVGTCLFIAKVYDVDGSMNVSHSVKYDILPQAPNCSIEGLQEDEWYAGQLQLRASVEDGDFLDSAEVLFEYSWNSTDGKNGQWVRCGSPVTSDPYSMVWDSKVLSTGVDQIWLRAHAVDSHGLSSAYDSVRIRINNSANGVTFDSQSGDSNIPVDGALNVQFDVRPLHEDGSPMTDAEILELVELRDLAGNVVECSFEVGADGKSIIATPVNALLGQAEYALVLKERVQVNDELLPIFSGVFTTTYGEISGLMFSTIPTTCTAGEVWDPSIEILLIDTNGNRVENGNRRIKLTLSSKEAVIDSYYSQADKGISKFTGLSCSVAGEISLVATVEEDGITTEAKVMVQPGEIGGFQIDFESSVEAGEPLRMVITALDSFGNIKTDYNGFPELQTSDEQATSLSLPGFYASDNGQKLYTGNLFFSTLGSQWIKIVDGNVSSAAIPVSVVNAPPNRPSALSPKGGAVVGLIPELHASAFQDVDNSTHGASRWQLSESSLFDNLLIDTGVIEANVSFEVSEGILEPGKTYYWRVQYQDKPIGGETGKWSHWSMPAEFNTANAFPFVDSFVEDKGWTMTGSDGWRRDVVQPGIQGLPPRDTSASSDETILAFYPNAFAPSSISETAYIISPPIDCSSQPHVELSFNRWLGIDTNDWADAEVAVSKNGVDWHVVWENPPDGVVDEAWQKQRFDITQFAAGAESLYIRFGYGPTFFSLPHCAWNIDDVRVDGGAVGLVDVVLQTEQTDVKEGDTVDVRLMVRENSLDAVGFLGGSFDLHYDPNGLQLVSDATPEGTIQSPYDQFHTGGTFSSGMITNLSGVTLENGHGDGDLVCFAAFSFKAIAGGSHTISVAVTDEGIVLPSPVGQQSKWSVSVTDLVVEVEAVTPPKPLQLSISVQPDAVVAGGEFDVHVLAQQFHPDASGFLGGSLDLLFDSQIVELVDFDPANAIMAPFNDYTVSGTAAESRVDELGGFTLTSGLGNEEPVLFAKVRFKAKKPGQAAFQIRSGQSEMVLTYPVGQIEREDVNWGEGYVLGITDWPVARIQSELGAQSNDDSPTIAVGGYGITQYRFSVDGGDWSEALNISTPVVLAQLSEGSHELRLLGANAQSEWQPEGDATVIQWSVDKTPPTAPTLTDASPVEGSWSKTRQIAMTWDDGVDTGGTGIAGYEYEWTDSDSPPSVLNQFSNQLPEFYELSSIGQQWLHVRTRDMAGNVSNVSSFGPWGFDNKAPVLAISSDLILNGPIPLELSIDEADSGIDTILWEAVGENASFAVFDSKTVQQPVFHGQQNGYYSLRVTVLDNAGNESSTELTVSYVRSAPSIQQVQINEDAESTRDPNVSVTVKVVMGNASILQYQVLHEGMISDWSDAPLVENEFQFEYELTIEDGEKQLSVVVRDANHPFSDYTSEPKSDSILLDQKSWSLQFSVDGCSQTTLSLGTSLRGTVEYDEGIDQLASSIPAWQNHACFVDPSSDLLLYTDVRNSNVESEWYLLVNAMSSDVTLSWDDANLPDWLGLEITQVRWDGSNWVDSGSSYQVNLSDQIVVPTGAYTFFRIGKVEKIESLDTDNDLLPDDWEREHFNGTIDATPDGDPDGDGQDNYFEYMSGLDPNDSSSRLRVDYQSINGSTMEIHVWPIIDGRDYKLQHSSDLDEFSDEIPESSEIYRVLRMTDTIDSSEADFYRVRILLE